MKTIDNFTYSLKEYSEYKFRYKFSFKKNEKDGNSDYFEIYSDNPYSHDVYDLINSYFDGYMLEMEHKSTKELDDEEDWLINQQLKEFL